MWLCACVTCPHCIVRRLICISLPVIPPMCPCECVSPCVRGPGPPEGPGLPGVSVVPQGCPIALFIWESGSPGRVAISYNQLGKYLELLLLFYIMIYNVIIGYELYPSWRGSSLLLGGVCRPIVLVLGPSKGSRILLAPNEGGTLKVMDEKYRMPLLKAASHVHSPFPKLSVPPHPCSSHHLQRSSLVGCW